ncbi:MAG: response regulator [Bacteroidia bacterium]|jgi:CheY-like chemotaxis protein
MSAAYESQSINILLVEDNPGDIRLTQEVLKEGKLQNTLSVVMDGEEAMLYLKKEAQYKNAITPDLILLDLNLPKRDGREVLSMIKNDPALVCIPVIILTTSAAEADVHGTYSNHANCYITKPVDFSQFICVIRAIENFWLTIVKLPYREK